MKLIIVIFSLLFSVFSFSQNIKRIIDKNDIKALTNYCNDVDIIEVQIPILADDKKYYPVSALVYATKKEKFELVKTLISHKEKLVDFDNQLAIAFDVAIMEQHTKLINYLFKLKPNVNQICELCGHQNAIMLAVLNGGQDLFFKINTNSEYNLINVDSNNLYHLIGQEKERFNIKIFEDIKTNNNIDINLINVFGRTPLQVSARQGNDTLFFELLKLDAMHNELNDFYIDAIVGKSDRIYNYVRTLFKSSPNWGLVKNRKDDGNTLHPIEYAIKFNNTKVTKLIYKEMFAEVLKDNDAEKIKILVDVLGSRQMENDQFWPLWEVINLLNKDLFQFLVTEIDKLNDLNIEFTSYNKFIDGDYTENAEVLFTKFEYRSAKRRFGKNYVKGLYKKLNIKF